jgi:hypothetical protein
MSKPGHDVGREGSRSPFGADYDRPGLSPCAFPSCSNSDWTDAVATTASSTDRNGSPRFNDGLTVRLSMVGNRARFDSDSSRSRPRLATTRCPLSPERGPLVAWNLRTIQNQD